MSSQPRRSSQAPKIARKKMTGASIPTASHRWDKKVLDSLGVIFERDSTLMEVDFIFSRFPEGLQKIVDTIAGELESVNNGTVITPDFKFRPNKAVPDMIHFKSAFRHLSKILSRNESISSTPQTHSPFTTPPTQTITPLSLQNPLSSFSQHAFSRNPRYSSGSTTSSGSNESGPEASSNSFAINFLEATLFSIEDEFNASWARLSEYRIIPNPRQAMDFKLGPEEDDMIAAISDGGLSLQPKPNSSKEYPILCIEAKRQKYAQLGRESTDYSHAAQIYAQMLGMVCDQKLHMRASPQYDDYQEAFVLHLRHATFYVFYARFPNSYLKSISEFGPLHLERQPPSNRIGGIETPPIRLQRSRRYRMRKPRDQASFFRQLVNILWYLASGNSKVGHMNMDDWNPLYQKLHGLQKPEIFESIRVRSVPKSSIEESSDSDSGPEYHMLKRIASDEGSVASSIGAETGSPMVD